MWYVNTLFDQPQVESLSAKGFLVRSSGGVVRIEKHNCGAELRKTPDGHYQMTIIPTVMMQGQFTRLWDAGYQKFLLNAEGKKYPIRVDQLTDMSERGSSPVVELFQTLGDAGGTIVRLRTRAHALSSCLDATATLTMIGAGQ